MQNTWYEPLRQIRSFCSQKSKIAHMGELAEQRRQHLGQFFTPDSVAAFMWRIVSGHAFHTILDNSIGSVRLIQFADPAKHAIYGVDVHAPTIEAVKQVLEQTGFAGDVICAGMQEIKPRGMDLALINPPFSIHLESPFLTPHSGCTRIGRFWANTSATSDEYALRQALSASNVVIALVPKSTADQVVESVLAEVAVRLRAVFDLPASTFKEEDANVLTSILVFGELRSVRNFVRKQINDLAEPLSELNLAHAFSRPHAQKPWLKLQTLDSSKPVITLPVTGEAHVRVAVSGRKIVLGFKCGFTQARVENAILKGRVFSTEHHRLPEKVQYAGQGQLDLEVYLIQPDPVGAFDRLLETIRDNGGEVVLAPGVMETIANKHKRHLRQALPLSHTVWTRGTGGQSALVGVACKTHSVDSSKWLAPLIKQGELVEFRKLPDGTFTFSKAEKSYSIAADDLEAKFELQGVSEGWHQVHEGLINHYPQHATLLRKRAEKLGLKILLSWDFQFEDAIELTMKPAGGVGAWQQACGKSRLAAGLILLSGSKHGLMVLESRLIGEMVDQLAKAGVDPALVNVIDSQDKLVTLKQINICSYERLRMAIDPKRPKMTYAKKLRRRIGVLVADEGEKLANLSSEQSRALMQISARKRYILTGTPQANYPRDIHGLLLFVGGDGTGAQPYGLRRGRIEANWINSMEFACRGLDAIRDDYVILEWVSWEFSETLRDGAKREIPKIGNVEKYRAWLAPFIKRRILDEPNVAQFIQLPPMIKETVTVEWDKQHLGMYLRVADEFAEWYNKESEDKRNNLAVLLAKLQAVQRALNFPQSGVAGEAPYTGFTSKQEAVLQKLQEIAATGKKSIMFAENPGLIRLMHQELKKRGVETVPFHGGSRLRGGWPTRMKDSETVQHRTFSPQRRLHELVTTSHRPTTWFSTISPGVGA